jgi:CPA1 family monovalent cation:H+ antiporter
VWATVVFGINVFAFIFIGLQLRPTLSALSSAGLDRYLLVSAAVLVTVILVRMAWHMAFNAAMRWHHNRFGFNPPRPMLRPSVGSGLVISWAGMRGIVTLAAALALPAGFPQRDLIVFTAFAIVLGTLVLQGLTLKPLLRALRLHDGNPVAKEERHAREVVVAAALGCAAAHGGGPAAQRLRVRFGRLAQRTEEEAAEPSAEDAAMREALRAARAALLQLRESGQIGDDAFHAIENELDWMEVADPLRSANADQA